MGKPVGTASARPPGSSGVTLRPGSPGCSNPASTGSSGPTSGTSAAATETWSSIPAWASRRCRSTFPDLFDGDVSAFFTHGHYDHTGGGHEFERRASHTAEAVMLPNRRKPPSSPRTFLRRSLMPWPLTTPGGVAPAYLVDAVPFAGYDVSGYTIIPAPVTDAARRR